MRTKRREGEKRERRDRIRPESSTSHAAVCGGDIHCVWFLEPPSAPRAREIHCVVALPLSADRCRNRMGDVPLLAVKESKFAAELKESSADAIVDSTGRPSSVVEQPIRNSHPWYCTRRQHRT